VRGRIYYVYIMASKHRAIYIGVTNLLRRRVFKHKMGTASKFTAKYNCTRCVYFETFDEIRDAIGREKQLKTWRRSRKITLIESENPEWTDLFEWLDEHVEVESVRLANDDSVSTV
jgi:putative endonuclease